MAWISIQSMVLPSREFLISEVDREFLLQHPEAPRQLDPNDPSQAHLRQQWNEMFTEFLNRMVDSHFFRFFPNAPEHLDPHDPEQSVLIEYWNDIHDSIRDGTPSRWNWDNPPHAGDDASAASSTGSSTGPSTDAGAHPDVAVHLDESQFKELVHTALEGTHVIADSAEVLGYIAEAGGAGEESAVVWLGEALGPVGMIASTIVVLWATVHAFGTGRRLQEQEGFCYGVMWQVCGLPTADKGFISWAGDSEEELRESFYEGVESGREKGGWPSVHNRVMLSVAYFQAHGNDLDTARSMVLNELWHQVRETDLAADVLLWPAPASMRWD